MATQSSKTFCTYSLDPKQLKSAVAQARELVSRHSGKGHQDLASIHLDALLQCSDLGFSIEVYEILKAYVGQPTGVAAEQIDLAKTYIGLMEIIQKRRETEWHNFYEGCLSRYASPSIIRARALHALAIGQAMAGEKRTDLESSPAYARFGEAEAEYERSGDLVGSLKAAVGKLMMVRMANHQDWAIRLGEELLARAEAIGISAIGPATILYGALAGDHVLRGELYRARSLAWQGARIAGALPASKASGFSLFQWARIEFLLGSNKKALGIADKAERLQRDLDPLANVATRMLKFQILRSEGRFSEALSVADSIIADQLALTYQQDFEEFVDELFALCVEIGHETTFLKWRDRVRRPIARLPLLAQQNLEKKISGFHHQLNERWASARLVKKALNGAVCETFLLVDRKAGYVSGFCLGQPIDLIRRRGSNSARWVLLERLMKFYETRRAHPSDAADLQTFVSEEAGRSTVGNLATLRRRYRRAAQSLSAAKVIHLHDLYDKTLVSLPPSVNIYACG